MLAAAPCCNTTEDPLLMLRQLETIIGGMSREETKQAAELILSNVSEADLFDVILGALSETDKAELAAQIDDS